MEEDEEIQIENVLSNKSPYDNHPINAELVLESNLLNKNENVMNDVSIKNFKCELCGKKWYTTKGDLKRHINTVHEKKKFQCTLCHKEFGRKDNLMTHSRKCHLRTYDVKIETPDDDFRFDRKSDDDKDDGENQIEHSQYNPDSLKNFTHFMATQKPKDDVNVVSQNDKNHTVGRNILSKMQFIDNFCFCCGRSQSFSCHTTTK